MMRSRMNWTAKSAARPRPTKHGRPGPVANAVANGGSGRDQTQACESSLTLGLFRSSATVPATCPIPSPCAASWISGVPNAPSGSSAQPARPSTRPRRWCREAGAVLVTVAEGLRWEARASRLPPSRSEIYQTRAGGGISPETLRKIETGCLPSHGCLPRTGGAGVGGYLAWWHPPLEAVSGPSRVRGGVPLAAYPVYGSARRRRRGWSASAERSRRASISRRAASSRRTRPGP